MTKNGNEAEFSTFDGEKPRDEYGKFTETGRETKTVRVPAIYQGFIRSRLLEIAVNSGLYNIFSRVANNLGEDIQAWDLDEFLKFMENYTNVPISDAKRLYHFFRTDYWYDVNQNGAKLF